MSSIIKVFLLLAVMVCISKAQQCCLCVYNWNGIGSRNDIQDIQVYPTTSFCDRVEIIVTMNSGLRFCLNPKLKAVQKLMASIKKREASTTARPTELTFTPY